MDSDTPLRIWRIDDKRSDSLLCRSGGLMIRTVVVCSVDLKD